MNTMLKKPFHIPVSAGVYIFRRGRTLLYIGKAANLKKRLNSYWRKNSGAKVEMLFREATKVEWIELPSEIDALIKEAEFIKKYRPKYNILMRDDKSYFYVAVSSEEFPRIFISHEPRGEAREKRKERYIGPFTSSTALRDTLKFLRRAFPYCTCKRPHKRPCLNSQIGKCYGFCCIVDSSSAEEKESYRKNIRLITAVLQGRRTAIIKTIKREMKQASRQERYEDAGRLRNQLWNLENIFRHKMVFRDPARNRGKLAQELKIIVGASRPITRVEGYDISNISGKEATGSMAVFIDGIPAKSEYRKFKIKTVHKPNDVDMLKEVVRRRLLHPEWQLPDLMLIDGGKGQFNAAKAALKFQISNSKFQIIIAALAKREEELYLPQRKNPISLKSLPTDTAFFFKRVRDEAHRFARRYHHKLREITYRESKKT